MSAASVFTFTWKIENYSKSIQKENDYLESGIFVSNYFGRDEWYLKLYPNGWLKNTDAVYCFLYRKKSIEEITIDYTFHLIDPSGKVLISEKMINATYGEFQYSGRCWITRDYLQNLIKTWSEDVLTIRYVITMQEPQNKSSYYESKMKIGVNHNTFAWCIKEPDSSEWVSSKIFTFTELTSLEFILTAPDDDIIIEVKNKPFVIDRSLYVTCKMTLLNVEDNEQCSATDKHRFDNTESNRTWTFSKFFTKSALNEKNCIKNGYFNLIIELFVPNGIDFNRDQDSHTKYKIISGAKSIQYVDPTTALQTDLKNMFLDKNHSDVSLKADGELFCAHKNILSSRSPIFRAMFDCEMLEKKTSVVNITDLDSTTLGNFLNFLYTGTIDDSNYENSLKLLLAADKYQVESLTEKCAQMLMSSLTKKNACEVITFADMVKHKILKASALEFIKTNATTILNSEEWSIWTKQNIDLASEVVTSLAKQFSNASN